jgi:hypothetical protein
VPFEALEKTTGLTITGHDHTPDEMAYNDLIVNCVGSMQPYSHGEDPDGDIYKTITLTELTQAHPDLYRDLCIRVILNPGEVLPADIDCLQLTAKRIAADGAELPEVDLGGFNMESLFNDAFAAESVGDEVTEVIKAKFKEARIG